MTRPVFRSRVAKGGAFAVALIAMIGMFEGLRTKAYLDPVNIPTVCFGETKGVKLGDEYSVEECKEMLSESVVEHERGMVACLPNADKVPDPVYGAALSLTYNIGVGAFCKSTMAKHIRAGNYLLACNELPKWNKAGGRVLPGLTKRRAVERDMCLKGV